MNNPYENGTFVFEYKGRRTGMSNKEENCECGLTEDNTWSDEIFDRYGCDCEDDDD